MRGKEYHIHIAIQGGLTARGLEQLPRLPAPRAGPMYVEQPPGFEDKKKHNHVYKLRKALYDLK
jgi:hypothetical protein